MPLSLTVKKNMAVHNQIILYAQIQRKPLIYKDDTTGEYTQGNLSVTVVSGQRETGLYTRKTDVLNNIHYFNVPVFTGNPAMIKLMEPIEMGDIVFTKGNLTTKNIIKSKKCEKCGTEHIKNGTLTFVTPTHIEIVKKGLTMEEGAEKLRFNNEISDLATILGTICSPPEIVVDNKRAQVAQFQLAINRKYYIPDDDVENKTDYPWVKVYGREKVDDVMKRCKVGTVIFVDGFIKVRKYPELTIKCDNPECDGVIKWRDWTVDILAYAVEYCNNWKTDEDIAKERQELLEQAKESIFNSSEE